MQKTQFSISTTEEFIAATTQHISDKSFRLVRYHGWYSNRMRGARRKRKDAPEEQEEKKDVDIVLIANVSSMWPTRTQMAWMNSIQYP
jgi:Putative transposase